MRKLACTLQQRVVVVLVFRVDLRARLFDQVVKRLRAQVAEALARPEVYETIELAVRDVDALDAAWLRRIDGLEEHVAAAEQLLRAARVQDRARVRLRGDRER